MKKPAASLVMHSYPGMVAIVTARWNGKQNVMAAGWHSYISIEPPIYGVAIAPARYTHHLVQRSGVFAVQFLPAGRSEWIQKIGTLGGSEVDKFAALGLQWQDALTIDVPILDDAYVAYECRVMDVRSYGDHDWFVGAITQFHRDESLFQADGLPNLQLLEIPLYLGRSEYAVLDAGVRRRRHFQEGCWA
jgi:flavin reductase (DIM6/NTAB) family NADH-FMN oxidoreductase RutF